MLLSTETDIDLIIKKVSKPPITWPPAIKEKDRYKIYPMNAIGSLGISSKEL